MISKNIWGRVVSDIHGTFAAFTAVSLMGVILCVGGAMDLAELTKAKSRLQDTVDTASLAGAIIARRDEQFRYEAAEKSLMINIALADTGGLSEAPVIVFNDALREISVTAKTWYKPRFMGMVGMPAMTITANSKTGFAVEKVDPISVMLVLDISGSMAQSSSDGQVKIDTLKTAVSDLFQTLYDTSENQSLLLDNLRTGAVSYSSYIRSTHSLARGYSHTVNHANWLWAIGGTNSSSAMQYAHSRMVSEKANHGSNWRGYILFMTDGENNQPSSDTQTLTTCTQIRNQDITLYTVAFDAPQQGQDLLSACANDPDNYYESNGSDDLNQAFRQIGAEISTPVVRIKS